VKQHHDQNDAVVQLNNQVMRNRYAASKRSTPYHGIAPEIIRGRDQALLRAPRRRPAL
jgi:hypothetical protein